MKKENGNDMNRTVSEEMLSFINSNPTAFHAVSTTVDTLKKEGFEGLDEGDIWKVSPGKKYYVCRNDSSVIAFSIGSKVDSLSFNIVASHSDSPTFKIKENAVLKTSDKYTKLNTEGYGGMILSSWLDRPLSVAGRVVVKNDKGELESRLMKVDRDLLLIPNVAIHMNRKVNEGYEFNKQVDMLPLFSQGVKEDAFMDIIAKEAGVKREQILGSDLYLYTRDRGSIWGSEDEFVSSPRLDDQQCLFASLKAICESDNDSAVNVMACFDNEEVGSGTKQGADSTFLYDVLKRICLSLGKTEEEYMAALAKSFMLSADNAHAVHPNHPEHTDDGNCVYMNEGVVVKSHAGQKYTSDGMSMAMIKDIAQRAGVPLQYFANRSDKAGGSTLGNIAMSHVSVKCVDIGLPQLAMHSCYETAGVKDTLYMIDLMKEFYA